LNWNKSIRQTHRWLSMVFTLAVIVNLVAVLQNKYTAWVGLSAVIPLAFLFFTGLYLLCCRTPPSGAAVTAPTEPRLTSRAFGDYQRDVVGLFMRAECSSLSGNCCQQVRQGLLTMFPSGFQQTLFAKFLCLIVQSFGDTIGIKQDGVTGSQLAFFHRASPLLEQTHHCAG